MLAAATGDRGHRVRVDAGGSHQRVERALSADLVRIDVDDEQAATGDESNVVLVSA